MRNRLTFQSLNESINAILVGIQPKKEDNILSICGSGDAPFEMISNSANVLAIDYMKVQIDYTEMRKRFLQQGFYEEFLAVLSKELSPRDEAALKERNKRFTRKRIGLMERNLDKLELIRKDIFKLPEHISIQKFNKIYLSNATDYLYEDKARILTEFIKHIKKGTLIYSATPITTNINHKTPEQKDVLSTLEINMELSEKADKHERKIKRSFYHPTVYFKIE